MFFKSLIFITLSFTTILTSNSSASDIREQCENFIAHTMGSDASTHFDKIELQESTRQSIERICGQQFSAKHIYMWRITRADTLAGFALLDNVSGKMMPITFLVIFDHRNTIISSTVIKYRESHGHEVTNSAWLAQFKGKKAHSPIQIGNDIDAISGATISANSLTKGIRKLTLWLDEYQGTRIVEQPDLTDKNAK